MKRIDVARLLAIYITEFERRGIEPVQNGERLQHAFWMAQRIEWETWSEDKVHRWLGWIQCELHRHGVFTLEQLKEQSRVVSSQ